MKTMLGVLGSLALAVLGCGSSGGSYACLVGTGTSQVCIETTTAGSDTQSCGVGTQVDSCPRAGADGACQSTFASEFGPLTQTTWYYSGSATTSSTEMSGCMDIGGTWIQP